MMVLMMVLMMQSNDIALQQHSITHHRTNPTLSCYLMLRQGNNRTINPDFESGVKSIVVPKSVCPTNNWASIGSQYSRPVHRFFEDTTLQVEEEVSRSAW